MKPPLYLIRLLEAALRGYGWVIRIDGPIGGRVEVTLEHVDGPVLAAGWRQVDPIGWRFAGGTIRSRPTAREAQVGVHDLLREAQRIGGAR